MLKRIKIYENFDLLIHTHCFRNPICDGRKRHVDELRLDMTHDEQWIVEVQ